MFALNFLCLWKIETYFSSGKSYFFHLKLIKNVPSIIVIIIFITFSEMTEKKIFIRNRTGILILINYFFQNKLKDQVLTYLMFSIR